jgi:hypothetical protein
MLRRLNEWIAGYSYERKLIWISINKIVVCAKDMKPVGSIICGLHKIYKNFMKIISGNVEILVLIYVI